MMGLRFFSVGGAVLLSEEVVDGGEFGFYAGVGG